MTITDTHFRVHQKSKLSSLLQWKDFKDEQEFLECIEDYLFGKMIEQWDTGELVSQEEVFRALER